MLTRRKFVALAGSAITGVGLVTATQSNDEEARILLELINNTDNQIELAATVKKTAGEKATVRRSRLNPGDREHFHIEIDSGEIYEITGEAAVTSDDVTVEGFGNTPDASESTFNTRGADEATLADEDRVEVSLTSEKTVDITVPSENE